jgi:hypothetical protein
MEHTPDPWRILPEFRRLLRPGGHVILSVPFIYHLHGAPDDYFRFTSFGVYRLAAAAGLEVLEIATTGGLFHSICQALSIFTTACVWTSQAPLAASFLARFLALLANLIDGFDTGGVFHQSVNAVLLRP